MANKMYNIKKKPKYIPALRYNWLTRFYDTLFRVIMPEKQFKTELILQANILSNYRVLDFGVGTATLSIIAKYHRPSTKIIGVDVDDKIIEIAKKKIQNLGMKIQIDKYDGKVLPYRDNYFDCVISSLVFHHLDAEQKRNSLKEIRRVLKRDGVLHIADWGKPKNFLIRLLFYQVQLIDGFSGTTDNAKGLLPLYLNEAGFTGGMETKTYNTIFGTLSLYKARKCS